MSLYPFDSFQLRFVTYLLNFPRILLTGMINKNHKKVIIVKDKCHNTVQL